MGLTKEPPFAQAKCGFNHFYRAGGWSSQQPSRYDKGSPRKGVVNEEGSPWFACQFQVGWIKPVPAVL